MRSYLILELRRAIRDRQYIALVVGWPVGAYLLFSAVFGSEPSSGGINTNTALMVAMATFGAFGAVLTATGPRLASDRQGGWLRQMQLTPLGATRLLTARLAAALTLTLPAIVLTFAAAITVRGVSLAPWEWLGLTLALAAGCLPFTAIGVVIGLVGEGDNAQALTTATYLTMAALGGLWVPVAILPGPLQTVARALPSERLAELGWQIAAGHAPTLTAALVLVVWFGAAATVAGLLSRRQLRRV